MDVAKLILLQVDLQAVGVKLDLPHSDGDICQDAEVVDLVPVGPDDLPDLLLVVREVKCVQALLLLEGVYLSLLVINVPRSCFASVL